jgi:hypothetical protein
MVSWETVVEEASMPPLVLTPIQSGEGLPDCVYNARLVFARTFSLWKHHNLILVPRSTPGKSYRKLTFCLALRHCLATGKVPRSQLSRNGEPIDWVLHRGPKVEHQPATE